MSGEVRIVMLVLLSAAGAAILIYYLRKWVRISHTKSAAPSTWNSTSCDPSVAEVDRQERLPTDSASPAGSEEEATPSDNSEAFPEQAEVFEEDDGSRDGEEQDLSASTDQTQSVNEGSESITDEPVQPAKTATITFSEDGNRAPEEGPNSEIAVSSEEIGIEVLDSAAAPISDVDSHEDDEQDVAVGDIIEVHRENPRNKPRKYKGLVRAVPQPRDVKPQATHAVGEDPAQRERSLPIEVRLRFDSGGFCSVSLIARRSTGLPEDLTAAARAGEINLRAMQDEWYQDVVPDDLSDVLLDGTVWTQEEADRQCTWSLSGRAIYVLADRHDISGYVSQPSLDLGRDHLVLCSASLRGRVEQAILESGSQPATVLDESFGAPPGWVVFQGVVPKVPVDPAGEADIFNALRPRPRIEISLERGIRLGHANWLDGYPPSIRVYGDPEHFADVHIDGAPAVCDYDGAYRASGWDSLGSHNVWCSGTSKSYTIVPFEPSWELWEAYAFPIDPGETRRLAVCGPIVRAAATKPKPGGEGASICVPETNPVLLGPEPGQIAIAVRVSSLRGAPCIASPCFRPVWALPRDPLHCDKKITRVLFVAGTDTAEVPGQPGAAQVSDTGADVSSWCHLILDANRKGMMTDPDTKSVRALWLLHKRLARRIWKTRR